jgi:hypothetical protein
MSIPSTEESSLAQASFDYESVSQEVAGRLRDRANRISSLNVSTEHSISAPTR